MTSFIPSGAYQADLDIRMPARETPLWAHPLVAARAPNAACWIVVMPRRAGKSWLASGILHARSPGTSQRVDLRDLRTSVEKGGLSCLLEHTTEEPQPSAELLIIDEPGLGAKTGAADARVLAKGLQEIRSVGVVPIVFATPLEHSLLIGALGPDAPKDVVLPPALGDKEIDRMTAREPDWAPAVADMVRKTDPAWLRTPFLLELVLHVAETHPDLRKDVGSLLDAAVDEANQRHQYLFQVFRNGLSAAQRAEIRLRRWHAAGATPVVSARARVFAEPQMDIDPVMAAHLPDVIRIHHITDLHHGGDLRANVDAKDSSAAGRTLARLAGAGSPLESYLRHVEGLKSNGRSPHLVLVTGDLVNRPVAEFGEQALAWLEELESSLALHPDLRVEDPRVVLTGGNHDVAWDLCLEADAGARHAWFAQTFARYPHPQLNESRYAERRVFVRYPSAGLRIALLGSAESGGEVASDQDRERLEEYRRRFARLDDDAGVRDLVRTFERFDPAVVARPVIDRLTPEPGYLTLAAIHHPLSPVPSVEVAPYAGIVNAGQLKQALTHARTALVMHGHTHLGFLAAERMMGSDWTMRIAGAATLGSAASNEQNGYNEILIAREGGEHSIAVRQVRFDGGLWRHGPGHCFRPGAPAECALRELVTDHVEGTSA